MNTAHTGWWGKTRYAQAQRGDLRPRFVWPGRGGFVGGMGQGWNGGGAFDLAGWGNLRRPVASLIAALPLGNLFSLFRAITDVRGPQSRSPGHFRAGGH